MNQVKVQDKIIKLIILIMFFTSCKEKEKDIVIIKKDTEMLEKILKKQLEGGNSIDYQIYEYSEKDMDILKPILKNELKNKGFNFLDNEKFNEKIKIIFGRIIDKNSNSNYLYLNQFDKCLRQLLWNPNNKIDYNGIYIVKNDNFITDLYAIPEIIDYKKEYPSIAEIEESKIEILNNIENESMEISQWKDIEDLPEQRYKNIQILVNRNKYLFNDNKASFAWLKVNDIDFLESLVKTFGYVADKDLLKFVLDKNLSNNDEFGKVFWTKDCNNKLQFHKETLDIIENLSKDKQEKYFEKIVDYLDYLLIDKLNHAAVEVDLTFSQKTEMLGKLSYYATKATGNQGDYYYRFFKFLNNQEFVKEFEKQNYYNIKDFKEIFEETKTGGVGLPM